MKSFKQEIITIVKEIIRKEIMTVHSTLEGSSNLHDKGIVNSELYAQKVKSSRMENIIIKPKEKHDSNKTFKQVKSKVDVSKFRFWC